MALWVKHLQCEHDTQNPQKDGKEEQTAQRCSLAFARVPCHTTTQTHCNNNVSKLIPIRFLVNGLPYFLEEDKLSLPYNTGLLLGSIHMPGLFLYWINPFLV